MDRVFGHIPHVERKVFRRTTMNEISLFFTYAPLSLANKFKELQGLDLDFGAIQIQSNNAEIGQGELITYKDKDVDVTLLSTGILVNVPTSEYRDFETTVFAWDRLEHIMGVMNVEPMAWVFTKGNRFVFTQPLTEEMQRKEAIKMIFSEEYLSLASANSLFFEESTDKTRLFSCRYGFEKYSGKDALGLKFMIASQRYSLNELCAQVMETNKLLFDGWHWVMNRKMLEFLDGPKENP